jgi:glycerate kinase
VRVSAVDGPDGRRVNAHWVRLPPTPDAPNGTAVVEVASTSGLSMMRSLRPFDAHTVGLGQLIEAALAEGVTRVLVGLGGSASSDGGAGALHALGARLLDDDGREIAPGNRGLADLARADFSALRPAPEHGVVILTDVRNPLLGDRGAVRIFAPQKGAEEADLAVMERNLRRFRDVVARIRPDAGQLSETPGAGAAGGAGFGMMLWGAATASGATATAEQLGLPEAIRAADLVITGEGRFDSQTAEGKVVSYVTSVAASTGTPVALVAGLIDAPVDGFADAVELAALAGSREASMAETAKYARLAGARLGTRLRE